MPEAPKVHPNEAAATDERRKAERYPCALEPLISEWGTGGGESSLARVRNISATGLALVTPARVRPGRVLVIKLTRAAGGTSRPLLVRMIHTTEQPDGSWLSGGAFVRPLSQGEFEAILCEGSASETAAETRAGPNPEG